VVERPPAGPRVRTVQPQWRRAVPLMSALLWTAQLRRALA
jgi:hypothetical protein